MFVGGQSKVCGKLTKNLNFNNCDVEFVCDTGANISILTEATIDMLSLELQSGLKHQYAGMFFRCWCEGSQYQ